MMIRDLPIRVGAVVRTRDAYPYSLPTGLADGVEVTVLSYDKQTYNFVVRDSEGREWTIKALQNLDAGREHLLGARWLSANRAFFRVAARCGNPQTVSQDAGC